MSASLPRVGSIDHVELVVPNRYEAAQWYEKMLGLSPCNEYERWAEEGGPLMVSSDGGTTKLALFEGSAERGRTPVRIAFRIDGVGFLRFVDQLNALSLSDENGQRVTSSDVVDHERAFSLYFSDPYGTALELTTYDYETVEATLPTE